MKQTNRSLLITAYFIQCGDNRDMSEMSVLLQVGGDWLSLFKESTESDGQSLGTGDWKTSFLWGKPSGHCAVVMHCPFSQMGWEAGHAQSWKHSLEHAGWGSSQVGVQSLAHVFHSCPPLHSEAGGSSWAVAVAIFLGKGTFCTNLLIRIYLWLFQTSCHLLTDIWKKFSAHGIIFLLVDEIFPAKHKKKLCGPLI